MSIDFEVEASDKVEAAKYCRLGYTVSPAALSAPTTVTAWGKAIGISRGDKRDGIEYLRMDANATGPPVLCSEAPFFPESQLLKMYCTSLLRVTVWTMLWGDLDGFGRKHTAMV